KAIASIVATCIEAHRFQYRANMDIEKQIEEANTRNEKANRERTQFVALMSHELRTPVHHVVGFAEILRRSDQETLCPVDRSNYLDRIVDGGARLMRLTDSALKFASAEFGVLPLNETSFSLETLVEDCVAAISAQSKKNAVTIKVKCDPCSLVTADLARCQQIVGECLSNAVKFSPDGGIVCISVRCAPDHASITIEDEGPGFEDPQDKSLFTPFASTGDHLDRRAEGVGLGLPLAYRLARLHGADLIIANRPEGGASVTLAFPAYRVSQANAAGARSA
ncbi:MAG: HAMP domain-containing sensor histidine kinase, partial [Pseudomonadota bacterium]